MPKSLLHIFILNFSSVIIKSHNYAYLNVEIQARRRSTNIFVRFCMCVTSWLDIFKWHLDCAWVYIFYQIFIKSKTDYWTLQTSWKILSPLRLFYKNWNIKNKEDLSKWNLTNNLRFFLCYSSVSPCSFAYQT